MKQKSHSLMKANGLAINDYFALLLFRPSDMFMLHAAHHHAHAAAHTHHAQRICRHNTNNTNSCAAHSVVQSIVRSAV
jgi:hypothetical protein